MAATTNIFTKLRDYLTGMYKYFFTALALDNQDRSESKRTGVPVPNPGANFKNFLKLFGVALIIILLVCVGIWNSFIVSPKKKAKFNHHGINQYGKRY
jgi:uncharacterized membrane protein YiaA